MKQWQIDGKFGLDALKLVEAPDPRPGPFEALVGMKAASLNYRDLLMVRGEYNPRQPLPLVPLSDGVGEVVEVGAEVTRVKRGQRVAGIFAQKWLSGELDRDKLASTLGGPQPGTLSQLRCFHEDGLVSVPEHLTDEEAATLPCAAVTAWSALSQAQLEPGRTVLVQGTGGVSLFALQFAKLWGARVIATSSSDAKLARATALGAAEGINYRSVPSWGKEAKVRTGGAGVDLVIEVGGAGTLQESLRAVRPGGQLSLIGVLSGSKTDTSLLPILMQNVRVQGVFVGSRERFEEMNRALALHRLRPVVDRSFGFEELPAALAHVASGAHFGKVCVRVG